MPLEYLQYCTLPSARVQFPVLDALHAEHWSKLWMFASPDEAQSPHHCVY